jgi:hypothetical protein
MTPFRTERLANGIEVEFVDLGNRYFGDYHRVCVEVRVSVTLAGIGSMQQVRRLERMGVAGADVDAVRCHLVEAYWRSAGLYLAHPDYPARLATELTRAGRRHQPLRELG